VSQFNDRQVVQPFNRCAPGFGFQIVIGEHGRRPGVFQLNCGADRRGLPLISEHFCTIHKAWALLHFPVFVALAIDSFLSLNGQEIAMRLKIGVNE
jgi:hypothetical protein